MTRYLVAAALALFLALGAALWWQVQRNDTLAAEMTALRLSVASARAALDQAQTSAAVHRAHLERAEAEIDAWRDIENDLRSLEGHDAPLSPFLRAAADRLYARH